VGCEFIRNRIALWRTRAYPGAFQALLFTLDAFALGAEGGPALVVDQTQFAAFFGQAQVGVVFAQDQRYSAREVNMRYGSCVPG
jgi:hypothetical protein